MEVKTRVKWAGGATLAQHYGRMWKRTQKGDIEVKKDTKGDKVNNCEMDTKLGEFDKEHKS